MRVSRSLAPRRLLADLDTLRVFNPTGLIRDHPADLIRDALNRVAVAMAAGTVRNPAALLTAIVRDEAAYRRRQARRTAAVRRKPPARTRKERPE